MLKLKQTELQPLYRAATSNLNGGALAVLTIVANTKEEAEKYKQALEDSFKKTQWGYIYGDNPIYIEHNVIDVTVPLDYIQGHYDRRTKEFFFSIYGVKEIYEYRIYY